MIHTTHKQSEHFQKQFDLQEESVSTATDWLS